MTGRTRSIEGITVPTFLYGTAWKEDRTAGLVTDALRAGFRGIDTANQRKHYDEAAVGSALGKEMAGGSLKREDVFLQTKFTFRPGQDHRLPYDPEAPVARQVPQSFESSLAHLGMEKLDSYLLHGPLQRWGLSLADLEAWHAMEILREEGRVRLLGVSNFTADQLSELLRRTRVRPAFVQNRCYAALGWDADVRAVCNAEGIVYQGFSLLTANVDFLRAPLMSDIARRHGRTLAQIVFRFALEVGMIPLTGTTNARRMKEDLEVYDFELGPQDTRIIGRLGA